MYKIYRVIYESVQPVVQVTHNYKRVLFGLMVIFKSNFRSQHTFFKRYEIDEKKVTKT